MDESIKEQERQVGVRFFYILRMIIALGVIGLAIALLFLLLGRNG